MIHDWLIARAAGMPRWWWMATVVASVATGVLWPFAWYAR